MQRILKKKNRNVILLLGFLLICILLFILIGNMSKYRPLESSAIEQSVNTNIPLEFPRFIEKDINEREFNTADFINNVIYVQFIKDLNTFLSLKDLLTRYSSSNNFKILVIANDINNLINGLIDNNESIYFVTNKYEQYVSLFDASICCESFYVYDINNKYVFSDIIINNTEVLKTYLNKYVEKRVFYIRNYVDRNIGYSNEMLIDQINEYIAKTNTNYYLVALMTSICSNCLSGSILNKLDEINKQKTKNSVSVALLLNNHTENDIEILRNHFNIQYPVFVANPNTSTLWNRLINEYSEIELSNIVILLDNKGKIINVMEPRCKCLEKFIEEVLNIMEAEI